MLARAALMAALALPACAPTARPAVTTEIARAQPVAPETEAPATGPEVLVWTTAGEGEGAKASTHWIASTTGGYREIAETAGVLVGAGDAVWRWEERAEKVTTTPCKDGNPLPAGAGEATRITGARLGSAERVDIVKPPRSIDANELRLTATPVGSVGPYLFVREEQYMYGCGAHGMTGVTLSVWDLAGRASRDALAPEELQKAQGSERAEARQKLAQEEEVALDAVNFVAAVPRYTRRGTLEVDYAFTTFACYACGDGAWGSYTRATAVQARALPARLRAYERAPAAVGAFLAAHPDRALGGWSLVPAGPEIARAMREAFGAR
jgi:hypothetical protein